MLSTQQGDQQSRAELLGLLLKEVDLKPYMIRHGAGRDLYHLVALNLDDEEIGELSKVLELPLEPIRIAGIKVVPLPLEDGAEIGAVDGKYYNAEGKRWTASIAFSPIP